MPFSVLLAFPLDRKLFGGLDTIWDFFVFYCLRQTIVSIEKPWLCMFPLQGKQGWSLRFQR